MHTYTIDPETLLPHGAVRTRIENGALRRLDASDGGEYLVIYEERDPSYIDALHPAVTESIVEHFCLISASSSFVGM